MTAFLQDIVVLLVVAACCAFVAWQGYRTLAMTGKGKLGACCAKGCNAHDENHTVAKPPLDKLGTGQAAEQQRVQFIPSEMLVRRRSR